MGEKPVGYPVLGGLTGPQLGALAAALAGMSTADPVLVAEACKQLGLTPEQVEFLKPIVQFVGVLSLCAGRFDLYRRH